MWQVMANVTLKAQYITGNGIVHLAVYELTLGHYNICRHSFDENVFSLPIVIVKIMNLYIPPFHQQTIVRY